MSSSTTKGLREQPKEKGRLFRSKLSQKAFAEGFPKLDGKRFIRWTEYTETGSSSFHTHSKTPYGECQLLTFHAKSWRTEEVLFGTKHSSKQKNSLNPKPTRSLADFLCILLHPSSIYNICAHSTTRYGYLTRNYLTLKGHVLVSEYGSLQLLTEKFYFPAKAPLECQKEMERTHFTISGPPPVQEAHLEVARSTKGA